MKACCTAQTCAVQLFFEGLALEEGLLLYIYIYIQLEKGGIFQKVITSFFLEKKKKKVLCCEMMVKKRKVTLGYSRQHLNRTKFVSQELRYLNKKTNLSNPECLVQTEGPEMKNWKTNKTKGLF